MVKKKNNLFIKKQLLNIYYKQDLKLRLHKYIIRNSKISFIVRTHFFNQISLKKKINLSTIRYKCFFTEGRRSVSSKLNISRIPLRTLVYGGFINGYKRSSW